MGAGIVGLATARELLCRSPHATVVVVEKEHEVGLHQTGHNSGVIHSGVYYKPGSLKARLCVEGRAAMLDYCSEHRIPTRTSGKLIVAVEPNELERLDELHRRCVANGVANVERLGADGVAAIEPHARGIAALHVPGTACVDYRLVTAALRDDIVKAGADVRMGAAVLGIQEAADGARVDLAGGHAITARRVIVCAGLQSDRVAGRDSESPRIVPFRGSYYDLTPSAAARVRSMIYPVPDPRFPFLGVHFTRHIDDTVSCGPNAVLALARERYRRWAIDWRDLASVVGYRGTWKLARRYWRSGLAEVLDDLSKRRFVQAARHYLRELEADELVRGPMGIRAQAVDAGGGLLDDFAIVDRGPTTHVLNAPSPAATSSLAIAGVLADRLTDR